MADKSDHNYAAGYADGRRVFARELQMMFQSVAEADASASAVLTQVKATINDVASGNPSPVNPE